MECKNSPKGNLHCWSGKQPKIKQHICNGEISKMRRYFQGGRGFFSVPLNYVFMNIWLLVKPSLLMAVWPEKVLNPVDGHEGSDCQLAAVDGSLCDLGWILKQASCSALSLLFLVFIPLFRGCSCLLGVLGLCVACAALRVRAVAFSPPRPSRFGARARGRQCRSTWTRVRRLRSCSVRTYLPFSVCDLPAPGTEWCPASQGGCLTPGPLGSPW